ncbi:MAG: hypothetical protein ERJ68_00125 [Aphanocapsa feldmannii 277cI]|uniref:Uncharacterized protein n=1 Tax=Aphanocapsa feldmannii 277cI TaxID=2507554 RepID=A0A524RW22_9CHRO|nr:MAG: hypothetical protein ERJ68_00125 [Aphanocapsa feldmannii 277cI]
MLPLESDSDVASLLSDFGRRLVAPDQGRAQERGIILDLATVTVAEDDRVRTDGITGIATDLFATLPVNALLLVGPERGGKGPEQRYRLRRKPRRVLDGRLVELDLIEDVDHRPGRNALDLI